MKGLLGLVLCFVIAGFVAYQFVADFDPEKDAADFRAAVTPGMSWAAVADLNEPKKYFVYDIDSMNGVQGPINFNRDIIQQKIDDQRVEWGFCFEYRYSAKTAFKVNFNENGVVTGIEDVMTTSDLLQGKAFTQ